MISRLNTEHAAALAKLEAGCFTAPWQEEDFARAFQLPHFNAWGLFCQAGLVCYLSFSLLPPDLEILNLGTDQAWQRRGYAELLLGQLLTALPQLGAQQAWLEVRQHNQAALALYKKLGFQQVGIRPAYYQDTGEAALLLRFDSK